eukprot:TRINITY_DN62166_c0_g1_i1.p1 TRINITY_DN62166_c0_g1~~TRINITY_DN62166_c0_g1_i1.p1  ORF type:complete len:377 (-),score=51.17 TRINITY_DN62166_c0_g1_i1:26-1099(-)
MANATLAVTPEVPEIGSEVLRLFAGARWPFLRLAEKRALRAASGVMPLALRPGLAEEGRTVLYACGGVANGTSQQTSLAKVAFMDPRLGRWETADAVVGGRLYICGGTQGARALSSVESLDLRAAADQRQWETLAPMSQSRCGAVAGGVSGFLYVCGGMNPTRASVERFHPNESLWEVGPPMLKARALATAVTLAGSLYVCGGFNDHGVRVNLGCVERLDPIARGDWRAAPPLAKPRLRAAAAVLDCSIFICGGEGINGDMEHSMEVFELGGDKWTIAPPMASPRFGATAGSVAGCLFVFGGFEPQDSATTKTLGNLKHSKTHLIFDPEAQSWESTSHLSWFPRRGETVVAVRSPRK